MKGLAWFRKEITDQKENAQVNYANLTEGLTKRYNHGALDAFDNVLELLDQVEQPEVLSQEWIDYFSTNPENTKEFANNEDRFVPATELSKLVAGQPELPVIPDYVAEWIEDYKNDKETLWTSMASIGMTDKVYDFLWNEQGDIKENHIKYEDAYKRGYTVEEKKYQVFGTEGTITLAQYKGEIMEVVTMNGEMIGEIETDQFTEQEIKDYDERYFAFAVPVEEVTE